MKLLLLTPLLLTSDPDPFDQKLLLAKILNGILDRVEQNTLLKPHLNYTFRVHRTIQKLDSSGKVKTTKTENFVSFPIEGQSFRRLVAIDGQELSESEKKKEDFRLAKLKKLILSGENDSDKNPQAFEFNKDLSLKTINDLVNRFRFNLVSKEILDGNQTYRLDFEPSSNKLPIKRRIDRALNHTRGSFWIDVENYHIQQVHFELTSPIRIWWGVVGNIEQIKGMFKRRQISKDLWVSDHFELYMKGRILFKGLHSLRTVNWHDFQYRPASQLGGNPKGLSE